MPLRCLVYMRKSSKDTDESKQKYSLVRQENDIQKYFKSQAKLNSEDPEKNLIWRAEKGIDWFLEDGSAKVPAQGYEGKKVNRPEFLKMIKAIKTGKFDVLICTDLSRLSRNAQDTGTIVQLLDPYKEQPKQWYLEEIRTLDKSFTNSATDKFTLSLFMSVSKFENDQRAVNTASGMERKRSSGGTTGKAPAGYINRGTEKGDKYVEKHPENFDKMRRLWEMFLTGEYSLSEIYEYKSRLGVRHFYARKWRELSDSQLRTCFSNPYYKGVLKESVDQNSGEIESVAGNHPAMVTPEEFEKAQMILQKNGVKHAPYTKSLDLGTLIRSFAISSHYEFVTANGEKLPAKFNFESKRRYRCTSCDHRWFTTKEPENSKCTKCNTSIDDKTPYSVDERFTPLPNKKVGGKIIPGKTRRASPSISLDRVVKGLEKELSSLYISDDLFEVMRRQLYTLWLEEEKLHTTGIKRLISKLTKLEKEKSDLKRQKFNPNLPESDKGDLIESMMKVEEDLVEVQDEIQNFKEKHEESFERAWEKLQVLRDAKDILKEDEFEPKKALLLSLGSNLKIGKDKIEMVWREPFATLVKAKNSSHKKTPQNGAKHNFEGHGSQGRDRTDDKLVNSQLLYR